MTKFRIGCAGWSVPKEQATFFESEGSHLTRYASRFDSVEINSTFYREHRAGTFERWAATVQKDFQFAVKAPKEITHERKMADAEETLRSFLNSVENLEGKCGPLLFQLLPSLCFDLATARRFFAKLRRQSSAAVVCEPRHASWFTSDVSQLLEHFEIGRVAADPAIISAAAEPGGWKKTVYYRLHGSPRTYYSSYEPAFLDFLVEKLKGHSDADMVWCIFDNTAAGCATENAFSVSQRLCQVEIDLG